VPDLPASHVRRLAARPAVGPGAEHIYYRCPHDPANPRHRAAHPDHPTVSVREDALMTALETFFDQYVFGHDRAALLAAQFPASAAAQADRQAWQIAHLRTELTRIDVAERALISELEAPADPADPATAAYRARIRARYAELYAERTRTETSLAALEAAVPHDTDPALLDKLPVAAGILGDAPAGSKPPCPPPSTSAPCTAKTPTRSPSGPASPKTPPKPSPPCSPTPAPTTTPDTTYPVRRPHRCPGKRFTVRTRHPSNPDPPASPDPPRKIPGFRTSYRLGRMSMASRMRNPGSCATSSTARPCSA